MHELAITQSVVDVVRRRTGDRRVSVVRLQVGRLSGVVPDAMQFCYELVTPALRWRARRWSSSSRRDRGTAAPVAPTSSSPI